MRVCERENVASACEDEEPEYMCHPSTDHGVMDWMVLKTMCIYPTYEIIL